MKDKQKAYLLLLLNALLWGSATPIIKIGLKELSPLVFLYYRLLIASTFTLFYLIITNKVRDSIKLFNKVVLNLRASPEPFIPKQASGY